MKYTDSRRKVFAHLDRLARWAQHEKAGPVTVEWDLSNRCPLDCQDCHFSHLRTKGPGATQPSSLYEDCGDLADPVLIRRKLPELTIGGVKGIVWSGGGEPLVHPHWQEILADAAVLGFQQGMYTSGVGLTETTAEYLAGKVAWVVFSVDAPDKEAYVALKGSTIATFHAVCRAVEVVASRSPVVGVSFLVRESNWPQTEAMLDLGRRLGATYTVFRPAIVVDPDHPSVVASNPVWISDALPMLERLSAEPDVEIDVDRFRQYRDWYGRSYPVCYGIRLMTAITPDGRVWVCCQRRGMAGSCLGDLRTESFADIWARHPGEWRDFSQCRVMCRLHLVNQTLAEVFAPFTHRAFL